MSQILEADEELDLIRRWQNGGDQKALGRLIHKFDRMVAREVYKHRKSCPEYHEDLMQVGRLALMKSADMFDCSSGNRFATYAMWWLREYVKKAMIEHVVQGRSGCKGNTHRYAWEMLGKINDARSEDEEQALREEFAGRTGISVDRMREVETAFAYSDPLNVTGAYDEEGSDERTTVVADDAPSPEEQSIEALDSQRQLQAIRQAVEELPERQREVVQRRHLTGDGETLSNIARDYGVHPERVRQIERRAMEYVRRRAQEILPTLAAVPQVDTYAPKPTDEKPVRSRRPSQRKLEAMRQDRLNGMTWTAISAKHGYRARVGARLALEGAGMLTDDLIAVNDQTAISAKPQRGRRLAPQVLEQLGREWRTSRRKKEIAKRYGYSDTTGAWRALKNAGLLDAHPE